MTRDGQTLRDYGLHQLPETDWKLYDQCGCGAKWGEACVDLRFRQSKPKQNWTPHPNRPVISAMDGRALAEKVNNEMGK